MFVIRFMKPDEVGRLSKLIEDLQNHQKLDGVDSIPDRYELERLLFHKSPAGQCVPNNLGTFIAVAENKMDLDSRDNSNIVGYIIYTQKFNLSHGRQFYINSFFIEKPYRRHGLGRKFIEFMKQHGLLLGIDRFDVPFMNNNLIGQKFYQSLGAYLVNDEYHLIGAALDRRQRGEE